MCPWRTIAIEIMGAASSHAEAPPVRVTILLATHNGRLHLEEQFRSLQAQTHADWAVWMRDDGSTDGTQDLLARLAVSEPRARIVDAGGPRLGSTQNFGRLLALAADEPYVMFCDQDDVWLPGKIGATLTRLRACESRWGVDTPLLVHTGFRYADEQLRELPGRHVAAERLSQPADRVLNKLLSQNFVYGCTMLINRALARAAIPIPPEAEQHDYWLALVGAALGHTEYLPEPTLVYRQHAANVTGAFAAGRFRQRLRRVLYGWRSEHRLNVGRRAQVAALARHVGSRADPRTARLLAEFLAATGRGGWHSAWFAYRHGLRRQGRLQSLRYYLSLLAFDPTVSDSRQHLP
jgi:hypothetical protein